MEWRWEADVVDFFKTYLKLYAIKMQKVFYLGNSKVSHKKQFIDLFGKTLSRSEFHFWSRKSS